MSGCIGRLFFYLVVIYNTALTTGVLQVPEPANMRLAFLSRPTQGNGKQPPTPGLEKTKRF